MSQSHKFPKRTSSKQTSGFFEPGPWLTTHWLQVPHQESHKLKVLLRIYWDLLELLGTLTDFHCGGNALVGLLIFLTYRWKGSGLSLWVELNNMLLRKHIFVIEQEILKKEKKRTKKLLEPLKSELTIMSNTISTNGSNSSNSHTVANLLAALQSIKCHNYPKKEKKKQKQK